MKAILTIDGMSCQHCVKRVKLALEENFTAAKVSVDLASNQATLVVDQKIDDALAHEVIDDAGYTLTNITYEV